MKSEAAVLFLFVLLAPIRGFAMETIGTYDEVVKIKGEHARIILATDPEIKKRNLDLERYEIAIIDSNELWVVLFEPKGALRGTRGSPLKGVPGFTVELRKGDLSVLRSYFVR